MSADLPVNAMAKRYTPRHKEQDLRDEADEMSDLIGDDLARLCRVSNPTLEEDYEQRIRLLTSIEVKAHRAAENYTRLLAEHRAAMEGKR